jgi:cell division protein ZapE
MSVREVYEEELQKRGYQSDPAQLRAIEALERCAQEWTSYQSKRSGLLGKFLSRPEIPKGVYMFGGVGRGKSFLMDCFFAAAPVETESFPCF